MILAQHCERVISRHEAIVKFVYLPNITFFADLKLPRIVRDLIPHPSQVLQAFIGCIHQWNGKAITIGDMLQVVNIPAYTIPASVYIRAEAIQAFIRFNLNSA